METCMLSIDICTIYMYIYMCIYMCVQVQVYIHICICAPARAQFKDTLKPISHNIG